MPKIEYKSKRFQAKNRAIIDQANTIIEEYQLQGYAITLRQLYYQFVARGLIPNTPREYKHVGNVVNDAHLAGLIDWRAIIDRTRKTVENQYWEDPKEIIEACAAGYKIDIREDQSNYIEVWVEKEALAGIIERTCRELDVLSFACKGYVSQSAMWEAAQRMNDEEEKQIGRNTIILHLGDHDPSGIDMTRDIQDRLELFGTNTEVKRIALTMEQIKKYNPPPNPVKMTDTRCDGYRRLYGEESWELDALEPIVLDNLIRKHVKSLTNKSKLEALQGKQEEDRETLTEIADNL